MASPGSEYNYACQKCPRTFKLQEFYEKHQKVHLLKKQHVCSVCGFVYGAAKGLEGHMDSAHSEPQLDSRIHTPLPATHTHIPPPVRSLQTRPMTVPDPSSPVDLSPQIPEMPFFHFLQAQGVLSSTDLIKQAQQAMLAQMTNNARNGMNGLSLVPISIAAPSSPNSGTSSPHKQQPNDKSKIPSPAGTGNYKIYDEVPEIQDASDAQQNDSGFFRCTICTREFSGLNSLKKHVPIHTRRVQHKCDTCGYVFGKKEYLLDHMRKHTGEISPVCEVCGQTFNKSLKLKEHMKLHRNTNNENGGVSEYAPYRCHICKQCFSRPAPLGDHLRAAHSETVYKCDMCDATFGDVRGKNHHMYNEHQLDAFHQKCVWCPVCNQGFTRHYNLKVHMYKSHGKEYLENNFSQEELDSLMRPPPGSNSSKPSPPPRQRSDEESVIPGSPSGVLPISPPLTPKLSPKAKTAGPTDDSPTMVPSSSIIPSASILKANLQQRPRPGPASLTKPQHYFDQEAQHSMLKCQLCEDKFLRKSDLFIHLGQQHGVRVLSCPQCEDRFLEAADLQRHLASVHGQICRNPGESTGQNKEGSSTSLPAGNGVRRPGPASRTNAPKEIRGGAGGMVASNLPSHLASQCGDQGQGFPCKQCGKVLMHKQSYVSHMRVIHGDYYGGNKWQGSSVVEMVLGGQQGGLKRSSPGVSDSIRDQLKEAVNGDRSSSQSSSPNYNDFKFGLACEFCNKAFTDQTQLDDHIQSKHPNLTKRIQAFKAALGLNDSEEPDTKRFKLDYKGIFKDQNENSLPSYSVLSFSDAHTAHLSSSSGYDEPLDLACKPITVSINDTLEEEEEAERLELEMHDDDEADEDVSSASLHFSAISSHGNSNDLLMQVARSPRPSPPCSPLNLHVPRPSTPSPTPSPTTQSAATPSSQHQRHAATLPPAPGGPETPSQPFRAQSPAPSPLHTLGVGNTDQVTDGGSHQPKLHEYLVKQSNATSDENGRKKFLCPVCKCQLSWKTNLSVHLRTHSGERPFHCVLCLNRFRQKAHLYKHFRCSHGHKVAPYKCMFCNETFMRSPNDLYNHITEVHKRETDELTNNNNNTSNNNNLCKNENEEISLQEKTLLPPVQEESQEYFSEEIRPETQESKFEENYVEEDEEEYFQVKDRDDDNRYEAIEEEFEFNGDKIQPCYCVLPFVSDEEVENMTARNIAEYYEQPEEYSEDEEGQMVIDENPPNISCEPSPELKTCPAPCSPILSNNNIGNFNNNELKINSFGQAFAEVINICRKEGGHIPAQPQPTHTVKLEQQHPQQLLYPTFPDFTLPFSLSGLIQKKKAEMAAILAPRLTSPKQEHRVNLDHLAKVSLSAKPSPLSPAKSDSGSSHSNSTTHNTAVSEYENQIQNDLWPIDCIKCTSVLTNLDNFNIHMNDHWSDDKCCPVCGLLINSKRFNFKQHLKIHTGEKPFVCQVCSRAFRQKAHMVKHVTTHRTEPRGGGLGEAMGLGPYQSENSILNLQVPGLKLETSGVVVQ